MSVTTDWSVANALSAVKKSKPMSANEVAELMGLTPFQITARLKGMEGRKLVCRQDGLWVLTDTGIALGKGTEPAAPPKVVRIRMPGQAAVPLPDDKRVPHVASDASWSLYYIWHGTDPEKIKRIDVFMDSEGVEYVKAHPMETADLIMTFHHKTEGLTPYRLRKLENSTLKRTIDRHDKEQYEREKARIAARNRANNKLEVV